MVKVKPRARSLNAAGVPSSSNRPAFITNTCAHRSASSMYAVLTITLRFSSSTNCCTIFHRSRRDSGSTPTLGSSSSSRSGERTSVQARPSFCFMPPDSLPAGRAVKRTRSVISSIRAKRLLRSAGGTPCRSAYKSRFSCTLRSSYSPKRCGM